MGREEEVEFFLRVRSSMAPAVVVVRIHQWFCNGTAAAATAASHPAFCIICSIATTTTNTTTATTTTTTTNNTIITTIGIQSQ